MHVNGLQRLKSLQRKFLLLSFFTVTETNSCRNTESSSALWTCVGRFELITGCKSLKRRWQTCLFKICFMTNVPSEDKPLTGWQKKVQELWIRWKVYMHFTTKQPSDGKLFNLFTSEVPQTYYFLVFLCFQRAPWPFLSKADGKTSKPTLTFVI